MPTENKFSPRLGQYPPIKNVGSNLLWNVPKKHQETVILGLHLAGNRRFSNIEEERTFQPVGIAMVPMAQRTFCILETARVIGMLG